MSRLDVEPETKGTMVGLDRLPPKEQLGILKSFMERVGEGVVVVDRTGRFLVFNPTAERVFGIPPPESTVYQRAVRDFQVFRADARTPLPPQELPLARALKGESTDHVELFLRNSISPEGVWISISGRPLLDEAGSLVGGVVVFQDITDRRRAEEALRESEERFSNVFHASHTAIAIATLEGSYLDVNESMLRLTGFSKEEMIGHTSLDLGLIDPVIRERLAQQLRREGSIQDVELEIRDKLGNAHVILSSIQRIQIGGEERFLNMFHDIKDRKPTIDAAGGLAEGKTVITFENRYRCKDGSHRWMSWNAYPLIEEKLIFAAARDITGQKQAEEIQSRLGAIVESSEDAILSKSVDGIILTWNHGAER